MRILITIILLINFCCLFGQSSDTSYYANGQIFCYRKGAFDDLVYYNYELSPMGDTLNLHEHNYSGNLAEYMSRSYSKNLDGEITATNGDGIYHRYEIKGDSVYLERMFEAHRYSMFYQLKRPTDKDAHEYLKLDSIFIDAFNTRSEYTKGEFIERLKVKVKELQIADTFNLLPYINIASDMLYLPWDNKPRVKDIQIPRDELPSYYNMLNKEVKNEIELSYAYEYFRHQSEIPKGEWLYYSGLPRFLKPLVSEHCLLNAYRYSMSSIVLVSKFNIETNNMFEPQYLKLSTIIDTLGNRFRQTKKLIIHDFLATLSSEENETIKTVSSIYDKVISNYYLKFMDDNKNRMGGIDIYRMEYYKLITRWQLNFPNCRLFNQNINDLLSESQWRPSSLLENLEKILEKFDNYLDEDRYSTLVQSELGMFSALTGIESYAVTPYNHYFMESEKYKRKFRRFNWLIK